MKKVISLVLAVILFGCADLDALFCFVDDFNVNARDDFLGGTIILLLTNAQFCLILFVRLCLCSAFSMC